MAKSGRKIELETVSGRTFVHEGDDLGYSYDGEYVVIENGKNGRAVYPTRNVARVWINMEALNAPAE